MANVFDGAHGRRKLNRDMHVPIARLVSALLICLLAGSGAAASKSVLFVVGEHEYGTKESLPAFAETELKPRGFDCEFVFAKSDDRKSPDCHVFPGLATALQRADLLFLSVRRRYPATADMEAIRAWINSGRPVVAIRTSSHAFGERAKGAGYQAPKGHAAWNTFDRDQLGIAYTGHYNARKGHDCVVRVASKEAGDPILKGLKLPERPLVYSHLYKSEVIDPAVRVLLRAVIAEESANEPVAWTLNRDGQRTFYTSIGGPEDMKLPWVRRLLLNAVNWTLAGDDGRLGAWVLSVQDPEGTVHHPRIIVSRRGDKLVGTYRAASDGRDYPAREVGFANNRLRFSVTGPEWTVSYDGRLSDGELLGRLRYDIAGQVGETEFSGRPE